MNLPSRYSIDNISRALEKPRVITDEIKRIYWRVSKIPRKLMFNFLYESSQNPLHKDWDNLIILDACRHDIFNQVINCSNKDDYIISAGSHSVEFCQNNFANTTFRDIVYVTANPHVQDIGQGSFHKLIYVNKSSANEQPGSGIHNIGFAPMNVLDAALRANEEYPNKRLIVHFMQPHAPYFGEKAENLRQRCNEDGLIFEFEAAKCQHDDYCTVSSLAEAAARGYISYSDIQDVYVENLEFVLDHTRRLMSILTGKTAITSDHGNYLGEYGKVEHPSHDYSEKLRKVPYLEIPGENRKEIKKSSDICQSEVDSNQIDERLRNLGYK
jgi:hypothetical protein